MFLPHSASFPVREAAGCTWELRQWHCDQAQHHLDLQWVLSFCHSYLLAFQIFLSAYLNIKFGLEPRNQHGCWVGNKYPDSESFGASQVSIHMGSSGHGSSSDLREWVSTKIHQSCRTVFGKITYLPLSEALIKCHATWRTSQSRKIKAHLASHLRRLQQLWEIDLYWRDASCTSREERNNRAGTWSECV